MLGELCVKGAERDAVHVAILPCEAAQDLEPNQDVGLDGSGKASLYSDNKIGKVDPFLRDTVRTGEYFNIVLYPNTVTGLRHDWKLPSLNSHDWLKALAEKHGTTYEQLMICLSSYSFGPLEGLMEEVRDNREEVMRHFYAVSGIQDNGEYFVCGC